MTFKKILKFGGSSVGSHQAIKQVIEITLEQKRQKNSVALVVSAFSGVTDQLINIGTLAAKGHKDYKKLLKKLSTRHVEAVKALIGTKRQGQVLTEVKLLIKELENVVQGVFLVKELSLPVLDFMMSFGERLSALIICQAIKDMGVESEFIDARKLVKTDNNFGNAKVDLKKTYANIKTYFKNRNQLPVITGFIASTVNGQTTTLGRSGSDYTASLFAAALKASVIEIWTDVDGIMTADPRKVKQAFPISSLTYEEAMEMSYFGAKVIHLFAMQPALEHNIPIHIKNSFNPKSAGTVISQKSLANKYIIKGISSIADISLLRVQGSGMVGVPGIAMRLFGALAKKGISVILIITSSSEHSISLAIEPKNQQAAKNAIEEEFFLEIKVHLIDRVIVENDSSIVAIVGENMRHQSGIAGKLFGALGKNDINVVAIAQASSELNISTIISKKNEEKALNVIHQAFFSGRKSYAPS